MGIGASTNETTNALAPCSARWRTADRILNGLVDDLVERFRCHTLVDDRSIVELILWASRSSWVSLLELMCLGLRGHDAL